MMIRGLFLVTLAFSVVGCGTGTVDETQILARVNDDEISIHQLNFAIDKSSPKILSVAERDALVEKIIDRQLAVQAAKQNGLDRRADVMLRFEEARRDILAAAYAEDVAAKSDKPSNEAAARFFAEHPGLFSERKVYRMREIILPADSPALAEVRTRLAKKENLTEVVTFLRQTPGRYTDQSVMRAAEQLPIEVVGRLVRVQRGETITFESSRGLVIYELQSSEPAALTWQEALPLIQKHLKTQGETQLIKDDLKRLRSTAKITRNQIESKL